MADNTDEFDTRSESSKRDDLTKTNVVPVSERKKTGDEDHCGRSKPSRASIRGH
jgi:hypothetical protein